MNENSIRYEHIKVNELVEFADRAINAAQPGQFVPITRQRAIAHAHNPYAAPDDVALLAAIDEDDEVVGYFGVMPMQLRVGNNIHKTHWFTTWSVSSKVRGRGVGSKLMQEALTLAQDFFIVGSVHARRVCRKYGFWEREPLTYYWIDTSGMGSLNPLTWVLRSIRKIAHLLKIDKTIAISNQTTKSLDRALAPLTKKFFNTYLGQVKTSWMPEFKFKEVDQIRTDPVESQDHPEVEMHRGIEIVNWMLTYPWVLETGQSPTEDKDYYFSDTRPLVRSIACELYAPDGDDYWGYAVFSVSQKGTSIFLKTLDFQLVKSQYFRYVLALALHFGQQFQADALEIPPELAPYLQSSLLGKILLQEKQRIYQCMPKSDDSPMAQSWHDIKLHLYDGDMAFS
jgi:GNAT superfamily N-acetyltransferase